MASRDRQNVPRRSLGNGSPSARDIATIALVAAWPSWFVSVVATDVLLRIGTRESTGENWVVASFSLPLVLAPVLCTFVDALAVLGLSARGHYRSDRWWLAGGVFVANALLVMLLIDIPTSGDSVYLHIVLSVLSGYWILTFAAGALIWRRRTPTFMPEQWTAVQDHSEE